MPRERAATTSGLVGPHGRRHHDHVGVTDVLGGVADDDAHAQRLETARHVRRLRVRSADRVALVRQELGNPAHANAANPHEVNPSRPSQHHAPAGTPFAEGRFAMSRTRSTITRAASGRAKRLTAAASWARRGSSSSSARMPRGQRGPGQLALLEQVRRADARQRLGVPALVIVGGGRQRHEDRRPADGGDLGQRRRAGAADDHVRRAHLLVHALEEGLDAGGEPGASQPLANHREIPLACLMRDLRRKRGPRQLRCCLDHGHVDRVRALGAAKDEHPPRPRWLWPDVQELGANGVPADETLLAEARRGLPVREGDGARDTGHETVGEAGLRVLLVQQHRHAAQPGGDRDRPRAVAADTDDDVRPPAGDDAHRVDGGERQRGDATSPVEGRLALQPEAADGVELEAGGRHGARLDAARGPGEGDDGVGPAREDLAGDGEAREQVSPGAAPGDHDAQAGVAHRIVTPPPPASRRPCAGTRAATGSGACRPPASTRTSTIRRR